MQPGNAKNSLALLLRHRNQPPANLADLHSTTTHARESQKRKAITTTEKISDHPPPKCKVTSATHNASVQPKYTTTKTATTSCMCSPHKPVSPYLNHDTHHGNILKALPSENPTTPRIEALTTQRHLRSTPNTELSVCLDLIFQRESCTRNESSPENARSRAGEMGETDQLPDHETMAEIPGAGEKSWR